MLNALLSPRVRAYGLLALVALASVGTHCGAHALGVRTGSREAREDEKQKAQIALARADADYREKEAGHAKAVEQIRVDFTAATARAKVVDSATVRALDTGARRVRIPVVRCRPDVSTLGPTPTGTDDSSTAELPGPIAASLWSLAVRADHYARQVNALQTWSSASVNLCNGGKP